MKSRSLFVTGETIMCLTYQLNASERCGIDMTGQQGFRYCDKCQGLFLGPGPAGVCPAGGKHDPSKSQNYTLGDDVGTQILDNWWLCGRCQVVFYAGFGTGVCPDSGGGGHNYAGTTAYDLNVSGGFSGQQVGWWWCNQCQGLYFYEQGTATTSGTCPAGGGHNTHPQLMALSPTPYFFGDRVIYITVSADNSTGPVVGGVRGVAQLPGKTI
jgi:hypothetical protein